MLWINEVATIRPCFVFVVIMKPVPLTAEFADRLRSTLIAAGFGSSRSASGVNIHKLAEITGYSTQICRKYLRGQVIPEANKLGEIASKLGVSPGWLLFGDSHSNGQITEHKITISKPLLHYIFCHANRLYQDEQDQNKLPDFLLDLTQDLSQINANDEQSKKIVDLALSSIERFTKTNPGVE